MSATTSEVAVRCRDAAEGAKDAYTAALHVYWNCQRLATSAADVSTAAAAVVENTSKTLAEARKAASKAASTADAATEAAASAKEAARVAYFDSHWGDVMANRADELHAQTSPWSHVGAIVVRRRHVIVVRRSGAQLPHMLSVASQLS
jgi:hypothetical protein